jgi:hypothetical protein
MAVKFQIVGLTADGKRVSVCYTRSAFEARAILAAGNPKFSQLIALGKDGEVSPDELDALANEGSSSNA